METDNREQNIQELLKKIQDAELTQKKVLTVDEACKYTGFAKSYIYKLVHYKKIGYYKPLGKVLFFDREDLEKFLLSNRVSTKEETDQKAQAYCMKNGKH